MPFMVRKNAQRIDLIIKETGLEEHIKTADIVITGEGVDLAIDRGAVLITCDNPDKILDILRQKGKHK